MNTLYDFLEQHDEVLDGIEHNLIAVNLPGHQRGGAGEQEPLDGFADTTVH
ncbi:hypothetical protein PUG81_02605 [Erwiniaceae bacterium L1_54_6]|jgi:hypothetical protein|nr:hypothetical protein [Erwiniaceae bacterium L1_54_6]